MMELKRVLMVYVGKVALRTGLSSMFAAQAPVRKRFSGCGGFQEWNRDRCCDVGVKVTGLWTGKRRSQGNQVRTFECSDCERTTCSDGSYSV